MSIRGQLKSVCVVLIGAVAGTTAALGATNVPQHLEWESAVTGHAIDMILLVPEKAPADRPLPLIIYLKNLAAPRIGTESDEVIIQEFRSSGYLVALLDFAAHPRARVPFINRDLVKLRDEVRARKFPMQHKVDDTHVFIIPSGSRLRRDVKFYQDGERTLALDIIYPSKPTRPVGAIIEFSCDNLDRFGNTSLSICSDTLLDGFVTEGFAVAMADHPVAPPYKGLDPMPESAWKVKAAVRTLRAEGRKLGLNGKMVPVGFSRGSGMALMLVTTGGMSEFDGHGENAKASSDVQGAVVMSGRYTYLDLLPDDKMLPRYAKAWGERESSLDVWRRHGALDYLTNSTKPLFLTINCTESSEALHQMTVLRRRLAELGSENIFMQDAERRGHKVTLVPEILDAMNNYLKKLLN